ncbi:MAG: hypothetical protein WBS19_20010 [Candidatus Korobacteraceae bacterium]
MSIRLPEELIKQRVSEIQRDLLAQSHHLRAVNFTAIHLADLEFLFNAYDMRFLGGLVRPALAGHTLTFRLSPRMTHAGGKTTRRTTRTGDVRYEIAVASSMLFDAFADADRGVSVAGLECGNRLDALQRVMEHEMVHLIEQLCWKSSDCSASRFQDMAARIFRHRAHTHNLVTRRERASAAGIMVGSRVTFTFEDRRLTGRVNRITKRATVLVEDPNGVRFSNGLRYKTYYVPIQWLKPAIATDPPSTSNLAEES